MTRTISYRGREWEQISQFSMRSGKMEIYGKRSGGWEVYDYPDGRCVHKADSVSIWDALDHATDAMEAEDWDGRDRAVHGPGKVGSLSDRLADLERLSATADDQREIEIRLDALEDRFDRLHEKVFADARRFDEHKYEYHKTAMGDLAACQAEINRVEARLDAIHEATRGAIGGDDAK